MIIQFEIFACIFAWFIVYLEKCFKLINHFSINIYLTAVAVKYRRKLRLTHARSIDMIYILCVFLENNHQSEHEISNKSKVYYPIICSQSSSYALIFSPDFTFPILLPMISLFTIFIFLCGFSPCVQIFRLCFKYKVKRWMLMVFIRIFF